MAENVSMVRTRSRHNRRLSPFKNDDMTCAICGCETPINLLIKENGRYVHAVRDGCRDQPGYKGELSRPANWGSQP